MYDRDRPIHPHTGRRVLELYAGCGGATEGITRALPAARRILAVERDPTAHLTGHCAGHGRAIQADVGDLLPRLPHYSSEFDLIWASPPCQPYSPAGHKLGADDPRDGVQLVIDIVRAYRPRYFICENIARFRNTDSCARLLDALREQYAYVDVWTLNAADFNVAQDRRRTFVVASHKPMRRPTPIHPRIPMRAIVGDHLTDSEQRPGNRVRPNTLPCRCIGTKGNTMVYDSKLGARRRLTWRESAALMGFPDHYPFQGTAEQKFRQIGNAVPPALAEAVTRGVMND